MTPLVHQVTSAEEIGQAASRLRRAVEQRAVSPDEVMAVFERWAENLDAGELKDIAGIPFLRMWLRRGTLEPVVRRELGEEALRNGWSEYGRAYCKAFPLGVIGHWPAGNVDIQPILSMTCALLGGNAALVRIPAGLLELTQRLMEKLAACDEGEVLTPRIFMAAFEHDSDDLQQAMARAVDGAMIWGGEEAVLHVRALPFPHWARIMVFGPRISVAAMDAGSWCDQTRRQAWCRRLARDVWQFDQQACSSPQTLFLERQPGASAGEFLRRLAKAFEEEERAHPRLNIAEDRTSAICRARAAWLLGDVSRDAIFPAGPQWTLLLGSGTAVPPPVQGRMLTVLEVDSLFDAVSQFDGNVQTLGLAMSDPTREDELASLAGRRGVDRVVKLGRMHVFVPPWDGMDLVRPLVRMVRHVPSGE